MSRYIDVEWLKIALELYRVVDLSEAPSIDIVHCRECKYDGTWKCPWRNTQVPRYPSANDFCSYGEREDDEID